MHHSVIPGLFRKQFHNLEEFSPDLMILTEDLIIFMCKDIRILNSMNTVP